jgi:hypothetical protein
MKSKKARDCQIALLSHHVEWKAGSGAHEAYDSEQASPRGEALDEEGEIFEKTASGVNFR